MGKQPCEVVFIYLFSYFTISANNGMNMKWEENAHFKMWEEKKKKKGKTPWNQVGAENPIHLLSVPVWYGLWFSKLMSSHGAHGYDVY